MSVLRHKQVEQRRQRAMDAAETLIRRMGSTDFTMLALAQEAGVSPATPYNLFGSKAGLMYGLLNRWMDQFLAHQASVRRAADPYARVLDAAGAVVDFFSGDPDFFRPLYQFLLGVSDTVNRPAYMDRALLFWKDAVSGLHDAQLLTPEIDRDELARELEIHFVGVLDLWVQHELDGAEFRAQTLYGTALLLMAVADDSHRPRLLARLRAAKKLLPRNFSFSRVRVARPPA